jgi:hypothetical protein
MSVKVERVEYGYYVDGWLFSAEIVHALVRLGMEAQRERSANKGGDTMFGRMPLSLIDELKRTIRAQPITTTDVQAALEGK